MCCRPRPGSRPGLLSCLICRRGLPFSPRRAGLILALSTSLSTSCCLYRSPFFPTPLPFHFLPPRNRCGGLPIFTPVPLTLSTAPLPLLPVNGVPSRLNCRLQRARTASDSAVSPRYPGGPQRCPVSFVPQVSRSSGYSLASWPISFPAHGMPSPLSIDLPVGVRLLPVLRLRPPPLPPPPSVHSRVAGPPTPLSSCWVYSRWPPQATDLNLVATICRLLCFPTPLIFLGPEGPSV